MASFDMGRAWNEAQATLTNNLPMIGGLIAAGSLVGAILQYGVFGFSEAAMTAQITAMTANGANADPTALLGFFGSLFGTIIASSLFSGAASVAATRLALVRGGEENIGSALVYGLVVTVAMLLVYFGAALVFSLVIGLLIGLLTAVGGGAVGAVLSVILVLTVLPVMLWLIVRLIISTPAMAAVRSVNPLYGIAQSWTLTRPVQWPLLGYVLLLIIAAIVISLILGLIGGLFTTMVGGATGEAIAALISGVPIGILSVGVAIGIWRVLAPDRSATVFE